MTPILKIDSVSKKYSISHNPGGYLSLRDRITGLVSTNHHQRKEEFWALEDVSFDVQHGDSVGIIGRNGAGKSTLLKILSRITPPTSGRIVARGRIASLLEVGTGFHAELTGAENIFFNGSLLGMRRREIESKFDEIVDFSGVEKFLDTPLKHFSSGMQLRLAFAVAAFLEPEIVIIDEVLAVGDAEFQKKCIGKMEDVSNSGRTILFVSHNLSAVENLCRKGMLFDKGRLVKQGPTRDIIDAYQESFSDICKNEWRATTEARTSIQLVRVSVSLSGSQPNHQLSITCCMSSHSDHQKVFVAFDVLNSRGTTVFQAIPKSEPFIPFSRSEQVITTQIDLPPLIPDHYRVSVWLGSHNTETLAWEREIVGFEILDSPIEGRNFPHSHHNGFLVPNSRVVS